MKYNITDFYGTPRILQPRLELYTVKDIMGNKMPGLAVVLDDVTNEVKPGGFCVLTVSFGEFIGMKNCAYIDTNNCDFTDQLLNQGIAKPTGFTKFSGFCEYPLWLFDESTLKKMGEENYEKYSNAFDEYMTGFNEDYKTDTNEDESFGMTM